MPRLISVRPTASPPRTPDRTGITPPPQAGPGSSPLQYVEHAPQRFRFDADADADTVLAGKINLDRRCRRRWLRDDRGRFRRNHHRDQLRSRPDRRRTRLVAIALSPAEYLV